MPSNLILALRIALADLDAAVQPQELDAIGRLRPLQRDGLWRIEIERRWWVTFRIVGGDACDVDLIEAR